MTKINLKFKSLAKTLSSHTEDIKHKLSSHLSEVMLNVLSKKQVINSDNQEEIQAKVETATKKLVKEIAKGKINSEEQVSKLIEKAVEDITGNTSGTSAEEGENSRGFLLFAATTVTQLDNSPLVKSLLKAVVGKLTEVALNTLDNVPAFANGIDKLHHSPLAMHGLKKAGDLEIPLPLVGDIAEEAIDQFIAHVNGQTPSA
jgi:hypothetical protein